MSAPGSEFAGFRVDGFLGRGGAGRVYSAWDGADHVALKVFDAMAERSRVAAEADLGTRLQHDNIVAVVGWGEFGGILWESMPYIDGVSASTLVDRRSPAGVHHVGRIVTDVAAALDHAHGIGVVHRDVKPANILLGVDGRVFLSDWELATEIGATSASVSDRTVLASLPYAAPELLRGERIVAETDIYALGATLAELLTGATPFRAATAFGIMDAHMRREPPSIRTRRPELPKLLDAVVQRAMAKEPRDRFGSGADMAAAVARALTYYRPPAR